MNLPLRAYPKVGNKVLIALGGLNRDSKLDEGGYKYDKHQYHISDRFTDLKWSKSLIKQLLVYVASCNSVGEVAVISESVMAKAMGVSIRTIQHNNCLLKKAGILNWERVFSEVITVSFTHYNYDIIGLETEGIEKTEDQATGYTYIEDTTIKELLNEQDVNVLRASLRFLALAETHFNDSSQSTEIHLYFKDLTNFLPKYVGYKAKIKDICSKAKRFVPVKLIEGKEKVFNFLKNQRVTKSVVRKAKDTLVFVMQREAHKPASRKRLEDTYRLNVQFRKFKDEALKKDYMVPNASIQLNRDDAGSLISTFGFEKLKEAVWRLYDMMKNHRLFPENTDLETDFYIQTFYQQPSKAIRYVANTL